MRSMSKIVVVGGASEVSYAIIERFYQANAPYIQVGEKDQKAFERWRDEGEFKGDVYFNELDLKNNDSIASFAKQVKHTFGTINELIVVAYGGLRSEAQINMETIGATTVEESLRLNLIGPMLTVMQLTPLLEQGSTITYVPPFNSIRDDCDLPAYNAAKTGMGGFFQGMNREFVTRKIRANLLQSKGNQSMDAKEIADAVFAIARNTHFSFDMHSYGK